MILSWDDDSCVFIKYKAQINLSGICKSFFKSTYDITAYDHVLILFVQGMRSKSQLGGQTLEQFTIEICDAFLSKVTYLKFKVYWEK